VLKVKTMGIRRMVKSAEGVAHCSAAQGSIKLLSSWHTTFSSPPNVPTPPQSTNPGIFAVCVAFEFHSLFSFGLCHSFAPFALGLENKSTCLRSSRSRRVRSSSAAMSFSSGRVVRYSAVITLLGRPSRAYFATAVSL